MSEFKQSVPIALQDCETRPNVESLECLDFGVINHVGMPVGRFTAHPC